LERERGAVVAVAEPFAEAPFRWQESLEEALAQAEREDKLVLLDFYSPT
jgi:hypothetical protein